MLQAFISGALLGLTSIPHCAAMCGPLAGFACTCAPGRNAAPRYQLGRTFGYGVAGALAGHAGSALLAVAPKGAAAWLAFAALAASACLLIARMLWPRRASERLVRLRVAPTRSASSRLMTLVPRDPLALGAASALLPCGALGAALLLAAATSAPWSGALLMVGFATSSGVALFIAVVATRGLQLRASPVVRRLAACVLIAAALLLMIRPVAALVAGPSAHGTPAVRCH